MSKKLILSISAVLLIATVAIGATFAYFTADTTATNVVTIGHVNIEATLDAKTNKQITPGEQFSVDGVTVKNLGNNPAYIRIQLRPPNQADSAKYDQIQVLRSGGNLNKNGDWYHYTAIVNPGDSVHFTGLATLRESIKASDMGGELELKYYVEAIQSEYMTSNSWPSDVEIKQYNG